MHMHLYWMLPYIPRLLDVESSSYNQQAYHNLTYNGLKSYHFHALEITLCLTCKLYMCKYFMYMQLPWLLRQHLQGKEQQQQSFQVRHKHAEREFYTQSRTSSFQNNLHIIDTFVNFHYHADKSYNHLNGTSGHKAPQDTRYEAHHTLSILLQSSLPVSIYMQM